METKQVIPGTKAPLRPALCEIQSDLNVALATDQSPVDWTATNTRVTLTIEDTWMDDAVVTPQFFTANSPGIDVEAGIYWCSLDLHIVNTEAQSNELSVAITNGAGTTVHATIDQLEIFNTSDVIAHISALIRLTTSDSIVLRAVEDQSAGTNLTVRSVTGYIQRIGNHDDED